jgi:hypothetical protein
VRCAICSTSEYRWCFARSLSEGFGQICNAQYYCEPCMTTRKVCDKCDCVYDSNKRDWCCKGCKSICDKCYEATPPCCRCRQPVCPSYARRVHRRTWCFECYERAQRRGIIFSDSD